MKRYTITLDDDPTVHKIIAKITGITSLPFTSGEKLVARASSYAPLAVFLDIHLEFGAIGLNFLPSLREQWNDVPIIVVTTDPASRQIAKALAYGANDFIRKPLDPEELIGRLEARMSEVKEKTNLDGLMVGDVIFSYAKRSLACGNKLAYLGQIEANLFGLLARGFGMSVSKDSLRSKLWGSITVSPNALDKKVSKVRNALREIDSTLIIRSAYRGGVSLEQVNLFNAI